MTALLSASACCYLCFNGFLFSVLLELEGLGQVYGRFIQRQAVNSGPKIQNVALDGTVGLEALADVLGQINRKIAGGIFGVCMHRTRAAALVGAAAQDFEETQVAEYLFH